jgi:hypothetical protein
MMLASSTVNDWKTVDGHLRDIASRRAALDAEEARWLREAERLKIWRELGMVSALDYMERVLGYAPHAALERLRVARAMEALPLLERALDGGDLCFSAIRELSRVATPGTEAAWRDRAFGKNLRQIEELVAGHARGDLPDDPKDPNLEPRTVKLVLSPEVFARLRQVQAVLADECEGRLDDDALVTALCEAVLARGGDVDATGRAKFQILMTVCAQCKQGHQEGSGVQVAVDAAAVDRAFCDAQHIGSHRTQRPCARRRTSRRVCGASCGGVTVGSARRRVVGRRAVSRSITAFTAPMAVRTIRRTCICCARHVTCPHIAEHSLLTAIRCSGRMRRPPWDQVVSTTRSSVRKRAMRSWGWDGNRTSRALRSTRPSPTWDPAPHSRN